MEYVCAKPACSEAVHVWLDFAPAVQQVLERATRTEISVGFCADHEARFSVPEGWSFERLAVAVEQVEVEPVSPEPVAVEQVPAAPPQRVRSPRAEGRPWFLALSDTTPSATIIDDDVTHAVEEPTVGSLLHRAFHGPDRDLDGDSDGDVEPETAQLPFPPFEPEHRVAVS